MDEDRRGWASLAGVSVLAGALLGSLDLAWQRLMPYPLADLGNSMAVWALGAFLIGAWVRAGPVRAAVAASVLNLVAVEAYYVTAMVVQHDSAASLWAPSTLAWLAAAVVAGAVFGVGGAWSAGGAWSSGGARSAGAASSVGGASSAGGGWARAARPWCRLVGRALPAAVFLAEAGISFVQGRGEDAAYRHERHQDTLMYAVIALLLVMVYGRGARGRATVLAAGVALAIPGFLALSIFTTQAV